MADKNNTRSQVKEITDRLEQGVQDLFTSEKYTAYLQTMSRFHHYSTRNTLLIHMQKPDATLVAGFQAWQNKFGRYVKKGERGIKILAPMPFLIKEEQQKLDPDTRRPVLGEDGLPVMEEVERRFARFKVTTVFDVSQTDGKPLPSLAEDIAGDVRQYELFMDALKVVSPLPIGIVPMDSDTDGRCIFGERIDIREGMSEVQTVSAVIHEIGHAKLHDIEVMRQLDANAKPKDNSTQEMEAESVSYAVCQYYGIETAANSFGYIASWSKTRELKELNASLDTIRKAATELIEGIDAQYRALAKERGIDLAAGREPSAPAAEQAGPADPGTVMEPEYGEQAARSAFDKLKPGDLIYLAGAVKPVQLISVREGDVLFVAPELAVELTQTHEQVLQSLRNNEQNRHLLAGAEEPAPAKEPETPPVTEQDNAQPDLKPNQHIETIGGVEFVFTGVSPAEQKPEKEYDLGYGHLGNGLTVWNRLEEKDGDYVTVAHIGPDRGVTFYDADMPDSVKARIENEARTSDMTVSATQDTPVFDTPAQTPGLDLPAPGPDPSDILPDPAISSFERDLYGYTGADILPLTQDRALELFDADHTIYMLHPDNTEAMAFDREEITAHEGIFGIDAEEWRESPEYKRMESEQSEGTREAMLLYGEKSAYGIYQLKSGDELRYHRWASLAELAKDDLALDRANYELVYTAPLDIRDKQTNLHKIYNDFSGDGERPSDFTGHSISKSDVIVLQWRGEVTSHYVDGGWNFKELISFLGNEAQPELASQEQPTYSQVGNTLEPPAPEHDGPTVAELEAEIKAGRQISVLDLARASHNERQGAVHKGRPSLLAQLQEYKNSAAQGADSSKAAPKHDAQREV